jgi:tetratricopeptide (TPR) repeat protein
MNPKVESIMEKVAKERSKGNHSKALRRLTDTLDKYPDELELYRQVVELSLEAGESLLSVKYFKKALSRFVDDRNSLWEYAMNQVKQFNDPVLGKFLLEQSVKNWNLVSAYRIAKYFDERTTRDLLARLRKKKESMSSALRGGLALSSELAINALSEAILNLRAGHIPEAIRLFLERMDDNSETCSQFEPLLLDLEKEFPHKGVVQLAIGGCYLLSGRENKGAKKMAQAVKMNASLGEEATNRLEESCRDIDSPPESLEMALLEIFLAQGNTSKASEQARSIIGTKPHQTQYILDHLQKILSEQRGDWTIDKLYLDISLESDQIQRILRHLKGFSRDVNTKRDLYDWLQNHLKNSNLPVEMMIFFGQDVLDAGRPEWAVEILRETLIKYPSDKPIVTKLLEKSRQVSPLIEEFYLEIAGQDTTEQQTSGFDIHHFERSEFSLSNYGDVGLEAAPENESSRPDTPPAVETLTSEPWPIESPVASLETTSGLEVDEWPRSTSKPGSGLSSVSREVSGPERETATAGDWTVAAATAAAEKLSAGPTAEPITEPVAEPTAEPIAEPITEPVAEPTAEPITEPVAEPTAEPTAEPITEPVAEPTAEPIAEPVPAGPDRQNRLESEFDRDYRHFLAGNLNNSTTLNLIDTALNLGKLEAARELLSFQPINSEEFSRRILCLAELHIHQNHVLPALIALKSIVQEALPAEEKQTFLRRLATCYRELQMYEAANSVLIEILNDKPANPVIEQLAKLNYEDYLNECCEGTLVLEKTSLLN